MFGMLVLGMTAGCGGSSRQTPPSATTTTCGIPYTFSPPGHAAIQSGSCAGLIVPTAPSLTVRRGQRLSVQITHELDGRPDFPIPTRTTAAIKILSQSDASVMYQAVSSGTASLIAHHTQFCAPLDPRVGSCTVLRVRVDP
jgi:hypothetical protein